MRNLHKALIAVFCSGVFITGIGTGISFSEFSSFAYSGRTMIGDVKMTTENLDYSQRFYRMRPFRRTPFVFRSPIT